MGTEQQHDKEQQEPLQLTWKSDFDRSVIELNFERRKWQRSKDEQSWNIYWATVGSTRALFNPENRIRLREDQLLNHFPNHHELTRKDLMLKHIKRYRKDFEKTHLTTFPDFLPPTYVLPSDYSMFVDEFRRRGSSATWIMKPTDRAQGVGIFLVTRLSQLKKWENKRSSAFMQRKSSHSSGGSTSDGIVVRGPVVGCSKLNHDLCSHPGGGNHKDTNIPSSSGESKQAYVISKYIKNPLLIGGKKFDLRMYVLVTSFKPLIAYEYKLGFARFCNANYSNDRSERDNQYVHLTNVSVQKNYESYNSSHGGKLSLENLKLYLRSTVGCEETAALFREIREIFQHSLRAVQKAMISDRHCFECYGYDIIIDDKLKPWLIEVNASPSISATTKTDKNLKMNLINDVLKIVTYNFDQRQGQIASCSSGGSIPKQVLGDFVVISDEVVQPSAEQVARMQSQQSKRVWR